jgi:hypothetical protein
MPSIPIYSSRIKWTKIGVLGETGFGVWIAAAGELGATTGCALSSTTVERSTVPNTAVTTRLKCLLIAQEKTKASKKTPTIWRSRQASYSSNQVDCTSTKSTSNPAVSTTRAGQPPIVPVTPSNRPTATSPVTQIRNSGAV